MPIFEEQLAATRAALDALLKQDKAEPTLTAAEVVSEIASELKAGSVSKERGEYLRTVLEQLAKNNFEATSFAKLPELNDPTLLKPQSVSIGTLQSLAAAAAQTGFSSNVVKDMTVPDKAKLIKHVILTPELIAKGKFGDKLDELMAFFNIDKEEMNDECELPWRISDLVRVLQQAVKLESIVEKSANAQAPSAAPSTLKPTAWPDDMASAKYDPVAKAYLRNESPWGADSGR